jgi:hypothetical protein
MRKLALLSLLAVSACGSFCDGLIASEQRQSQNAKSCGITFNAHDANKCNNNISKCSQDDISELRNYAACLDGLQMCTESNKTSYSFALTGCAFQPFGRISFNCSSAIF